MKKRGNGKKLVKASPDMQSESLNTWDNRTWDRIATKAYELYEQRGCLDGHALEDWLKAEAIISGTAE